jgi:hypothetical protein
LFNLDFSNILKPILLLVVSPTNMSDNLFDVPLYFISEYLNGWIILILIIIIFYFIILRQYYIKKEQFYDQAVAMKNIDEIKDIEESLLEDNNKISPNKEQSTKNNKSSNNNIKKQDKQKTKIFKQSDSVNKSFNQYNNTKNPNKYRKNNRDNKHKTNQVLEEFEGGEGIEGFESIENNIISNIKSNAVNEADNNYNSNKIISTTLFDNLNLNDVQLESCKMNYNQVINQYIKDLKKLLKLKNNNQYLNTNGQYDIIISKGIDNIINYLSNTIKTPNKLTRTTIRTDIVNTLKQLLEYLIDNENSILTSKINKLALLNSTTIDYNTMLQTINDSRNKLEEYIELDKLINNYSHNISNFNKEVNKNLDKSFILPIYERNFDKINQLIKSDFNDNETNLSTKYGQAYTDYLNEQKKEELNINPLRLASQIESGIVNVLSNISRNKDKINPEYNNKSILEQYSREYGYTGNDIDSAKSNIIPKQQSKLVNDTMLTDTNIYKDIGNRGNYLIDDKTRKQILEGFSTESDTNTKNSSNTLYNSKSKNSNKDKDKNDFISKIMSGDFVKYIMDFISEKMTNLYQMYINKYYANSTESSSFKLEENMLPAGFLFFILSMLIYLIDVTS